MSATNLSGPLFVAGVPVAPAIGGNVWWVDSGSGRDSNDGTWGRTRQYPFATIDYAIGQCTANNGDVIYVLPGHAETVSAASGIDVDVAGVSIIGIGEGADRPTITMSAVAATVEMAAANCLLQNLLLKAEEDITIVVDVNAADCKIKKCEFRSRTAATAKEFVTAIDVNGGAANACDRTVIEDCFFYSPTAGASRAIELGEVADSVLIQKNIAWGDWGDAAIHNITGKVLTNLQILRNQLTNLQSGDHAIELVSACTGIIGYNTVNSTLAAAATRTAIDPGSCYCVENYGSDGVGDVNGVLNPAADS